MPLNTRVVARTYTTYLQIQDYFSPLPDDEMDILSPPQTPSPGGVLLNVLTFAGRLHDDASELMRGRQNVDTLTIYTRRRGRSTNVRLRRDIPVDNTTGEVYSRILGKNMG